MASIFYCPLPVLVWLIFTLFYKIMCWRKHNLEWERWLGKFRPWQQIFFSLYSHSISSGERWHYLALRDVSDAEGLRASYAKRGGFTTRWRTKWNDPLVAQLLKANRGATGQGRWWWCGRGGRRGVVHVCVCGFVSGGDDDVCEVWNGPEWRREMDGWNGIVWVDDDEGVSFNAPPPPPQMASHSSSCNRSRCLGFGAWPAQSRHAWQQQLDRCSRAFSQSAIRFSRYKSPIRVRCPRNGKPSLNPQLFSFFLLQHNK